MRIEFIMNVAKDEYFMTPLKRESAIVIVPHLYSGEALKEIMKKSSVTAWPLKIYYS